MLYLIRHGQTQVNHVVQSLVDKHGEPEFYLTEQWKYHRFNPNNLDVGLTEKGYQQAYQAKQKMALIDVDVVLVSPMKRALHTCNIIFDGHKSQPPIIVEPLFRQVFYGATDIGVHIEQSIQKFPHFNFDNIKDKETWFVHSLSDEKDRQRILKVLEGIEGSERRERAKQEIMNLMKNYWPVEHAVYEAYHDSIDKMNTNWSSILKCVDQLLNEEKKVAIVSHGECLYRFTGYEMKN